MSEEAAPDVAPAAPDEPKHPKLPLRGMPFKLVDLKRATRHAFDAAGGKIKWSDARRRGYLWLVMMHFPQPFGVRRAL